MAGYETESSGRLNGVKVNDKDSIAAFIDYWSSQRKRFLGDVQRQAFLQICWTLGYQDYDFDRASTMLVDRASSEESAWWRVHAKENRLLPMVEGRIAKMMSREPIWRVMPATPDEEDESVADLGTLVLRHYWRNVLGMDQIMNEAHWWAETTGTAFMVSCWDPTAGPRLTVRQDDFLNRFAGEIDQESIDLYRRIVGQEAADSEMVPIGDVSVEVKTIFDVFIDPTAKTIEKANWALVRRFRTLDELEERYGRKAVRDLQPGVDMGDLSFHSQIARLAGGGMYDEGAIYDDLYAVEELWVRPGGRSRPAGIHATWCQQKVLQHQPNPYQHGQIPISVIQGLYQPFSILGGCKVQQLMETQSRLNDIRSNEMEYMMLHVYPKLLDPMVSGIDDDSFTTAFGERIRYMPPHKPDYLVPPPMPSYLQNMEGSLLQAMQDLSDIHEVTAGQAPQGVRTGRGILALQAQDDARYMTPIKLRNVAISRLGGQVLSMLNQFCTERRLIQMTSDDYEREVMVLKGVGGFIGSDLVGGRQGEMAVDYFRVIVDVDSQLPLSPEGQRTVVDSLLERQVLNPQQDRELILRMFGIGTSDPVFEGGRIHKSMAFKEQRLMASGQRIDPQKWHNHETHLACHLRWINSPEYDSLAPEAQKLVQIHLNRHYFLMSNEAMRMQLLLQMAQQTAPHILNAELREIMEQDAAESPGLPPELPQVNQPVSV
jgi:hypothetical protein